MEEIKLYSGLYRCKVTNEYGDEIGIIEFNPRDFNLPSRLEKGWKQIQKRLNEAKKAFAKYSGKFEQMQQVSNADKDTSVLDDETFSDVAKLISDIDVDIKSTLNYIFDSDISAVFGNTHLATPTKSGFLIENLMNALIPVMEREIKKAQNQSSARKNKYTQRYKK